MKNKLPGRLGRISPTSTGRKDSRKSIKVSEAKMNVSFSDANLPISNDIKSLVNRFKYKPNLPEITVEKIQADFEDDKTFIHLSLSNGYSIIYETGEYFSITDNGGSDVVSMDSSEFTNEVNGDIILMEMLSHFTNNIDDILQSS